MAPAGGGARQEEDQGVMAIRVVVFDIDGVLEITPDLGAVAPSAGLASGGR